MRFELDNILIDEIIFFMENQDGEFTLDTLERKIIDHNNKTDEDNGERYIDTPQWSSNDGYRLMEKFASDLKNPIIRQELSDALNRNKGVFRAYRDALARYPEMEKKWHNYKDAEMRKTITGWYNALREEWGLEPAGIEPEDNTSLVLEDFFIRAGEGEFNFTAETINGDSAASVSAVLEDTPGIGKALIVNNLEVNPVYRGMGIGKALLAKVIEKADEKDLDIIIDLPCESDFFSRSLYLENFKPVMKRFLRKNEKLKNA